MFSSIDSSTTEYYKIGKKANEKQRLIVLGTGWASFHFLKALDKQAYEIFVVSPRNYFVFTPLLPSVCSGTLSPESCIDSIRESTQKDKNNTINFLEASCDNVDFEKNSIACTSLSGKGFSIDYDYLVIGVGATSNTFGIKGVSEYAFFLKELDHALAIRKKIIENFEKAALPGINQDELDKLLHFAIVGGGPTGVEVAAELADYIREDLSKIFPKLMRHTRVTLIEMTDKLLPMFSSSASHYTKENFQKNLNVHTLLEHAVTEIDQNYIHIKDCSKSPQKGSEFKLPYGFVLWASGVGQVDLTKKIISTLSSQKGNRVMKVNPQFALKGIENVYAFGDCSYMEAPSFRGYAETFFKQTGKSHIDEDYLAHEVPSLSKIFPQLSPLKWNFMTKPKRGLMTLEEFIQYAGEIDTAYRPPPPTAQIARKGGYYLAEVFNKYKTPEDKKKAPIFTETWDGTLAYVGGNKAVANLPHFDVLGYPLSLSLWKAVYLTMQTSWRNIFICSTDWIKKSLGGRSSAKYS